MIPFGFSLGYPYGGYGGYGGYGYGHSLAHGGYYGSSILH